MAFASVERWLEWLWMDLTDMQWQQIKRFIPDDPVRADRRGRPWADQRKVLNGILWVLRTGAPWKDLPTRYGAYQTVHRRFTRWRKQGVIKAVLQGLAEDLHKRGGFDLSECFIDGSFAPAKKGELVWARPGAARAVKSWSSETLLVFQSPSTVKLLRPVR
jgi:transposase